MAAYYNEYDAYAAAWLRNLIEAGLIAPGEVDERSIEDVTPNDLRGFKQCHFFAGIGVWSYALRLAGWPDEREVWTGSCPCQPFSAAGKRGGTADKRHLWPAFFHLIEAMRPPVVLGEQVASKDGLNWLDLVQADLEGAGYAVGAVDLCAAGVGAPHIRQRLWFSGIRLADAAVRGRQQQSHGFGQHARILDQTANAKEQVLEPSADGAGDASGLAEPDNPERRSNGTRRHECNGSDARWSQGSGDVEGRGEHGRVGNAPDQSCKRGARCVLGEETAVDGSRLAVDGRVSVGPEYAGSSMGERPGPTNGHWRDADWLLCRDDKWRPVRPGSFPLAHGAPARVGRLRAYGNAIVAEAAREFIEAVAWSIGGDLA
jgi:DNA (cytosine-5)-methyltransferase 1